MFYITRLRLLNFFVLTLTLSIIGRATHAVTEYKLPPKEILDVMRAPSIPYPSMSPTLDRIMLITMEDYPSIARVATPFLRLAGVRIEPKNRSRHDTPGGYGIPACVRKLELVDVKDGKLKVIDTSKLACAEAPVWSADGKSFFIINKTMSAVELWIGDIKTGGIFQIPHLQLNPMFNEEVQWMPDQKNLLVKLRPIKQSAPPKSDESSVGPSIQESNGQNGLSSTYEKRDTLNNKADEKLFDYYGASQLAVVNIQTRSVKRFGLVALFEKIRPAPDGTHLLVTEITKPYSYLVTAERFPKKVQVLNISNLQKNSVQPIATLPLADRVPIHGVPVGPRSFSWHPHEPATLFWAEALDGGDWNVKVPARDKVMVLKTPFSTPAVEFLQTEQRFAGFDWLEETDQVLLNEYDENRHWRKTFIIKLSDSNHEKRILWDLSTDEEYANPGTPEPKILKNGFSVLRQNQKSIYLSGSGSSPEGDRPFLDKLDLTTLKSQRLFRSAKQEYEWFLSFIDNEDKSFLTWHQTPESVPNVYKRKLDKQISGAQGEAIFTSNFAQLTKILDPAPQIRSIKKQIIKYKRADGLDLSFTLYTPPGYKSGTRVPAILYAYPLDYAEASKAGQLTGSQFTFTRLRSYRLLLLAGYAIIDRAAFPIVGDPKKAYDTYTEQLVADAQAAIDQAVKSGVVDRNRVGVTGHSHGALMTVNVLAHTELFRAGVATSGSYNKTLTPFGFQSERRSVWQAPEVYKKVSPFFYADKIKKPLLIMHGADDANPGTTPMQASFLYEAIRGNGGTVRLVMLPHEPHWYTARESNEHEVFEMLSWFDKYVKDAPAQSKDETRK